MGIRQRSRGAARRRGKRLGLAVALHDAPDELAADFQQYYGIDSRRIGGDVDVDRAAVLCSQLPRGARVPRALAGESAAALEWTPVMTVVLYCLNVLRHVSWQISQDAAEGADPPAPISPSDLLGIGGADAQPVDGAAYLERLEALRAAAGREMTAEEFKEAR